MNILRNRWKQMQLRLLLSVLVLMGIGAGFCEAAWADAAVEEVEEPGRESARGSWQQEEGAWYFILPDGTKNREDVIWQNALYAFYYDGSLKSAQWIPNTGGGAYPVFCYDAETQELFDQLNEEKRDIFLRSIQNEWTAGTEMRRYNTIAMLVF